MKKYVIYTSITGEYDTLPQYDVLHPEFDYICFSNDYLPRSKIGQWLILPIPFQHSNSIHLSRFTKILPHKALSQYVWSVWIDANISIKTEKIYEDIKKCIEKDQTWCGIIHPRFDCIYQDIIACIKNGKVKFLEGKRQILMLRKAQYPNHNGLFENNIIVRKHNDPTVISISNSWWNIFYNYAPRDQFSLFYVFWIFKFSPSTIIKTNHNARNIESLHYIAHSKRNLTKRILLKLRTFWNNIQLKYYQLFDIYPLNDL